jgi:DNA mismatch repair protein PMS2
MATIKAIEGRSVHQIQSGQVIVDLNSVVKELVENSLDAGATSIDIRFKNQGLDSIEVSDNGKGISPDDFETIALKHYTSKLSSYEDLTSLETFGFRGEALSSMCALSKFHIITARVEDGAVGKRLDFEVSGKLKGTSVVAAQRGTTVIVENLFHSLPVRRKELEKNIKREYGKVTTLLNSYACISVGVRYAVSNQMPKGKKVVVFSTKSNTTTKENVVNVFGAKMLLALVKLDLKLDMEPSKGPSTQSARDRSTQAADRSREVLIQGHISRPVFGEGRQAPDRQMFFVNSRPCGLPQVSKAFNEVYKSFNVSQSPFIFANLIMDTNAYDVNVSPDKRSIMLHDQTALLDSLKTALTAMFEQTDHTVPQSTLPNRKLPSFRPPTLLKNFSTGPFVEEDEPQDGNEEEAEDEKGEEQIQPEEVSAAARRRVASRPNTNPVNLIESWAGRDSELRSDRPTKPQSSVAKGKGTVANAMQTDRGQRHAGVNSAASERRREDENLPRHLTPLDDVDDSHNGTQGKPPLHTTTEPDPMSTPYDDLSSQRPLSVPQRVQDFNAFMEQAREAGNADDAADEHKESKSPDAETPMELDPEPQIPAITPGSQTTTPGPVANAFDRMRPKRTPLQTAEITVGNQTTTTVIGSAPMYKKRRIHKPANSQAAASFGCSPLLARGLRNFAAPGTQFDVDSSDAQSQSSRRATRLDDQANNGEEAAASDDELLSDVSDNDNDDESEHSMNHVTNAPAHAPASLKEDHGTPISDPMSSTPLDLQDDDESDEDYIDEEAKKIKEDEKIARLIQEAEYAAAKPSSQNLQRASQLLKNASGRKDSTLQLCCTLSPSIEDIRIQSQALAAVTTASQAQYQCQDNAVVKDELDSTQAENKLSLTVTKADFDRMHIVGQFNLGFILAIRPASHDQDQDELFIIDQHAADEKYNYERFSRIITLQSQRLVQPKTLDLTAVEQEVVLNHADALKANGFEVEIVSTDNETSENDEEVTTTRTCRLLTLPTSHTTTFDLSDLSELLYLLSDAPTSSSVIPRPKKVQRMLAMRACRSSIMVGKVLTVKQMERVVRHMGEMEKPWNCPHGRPTMRHLAGMGEWRGWMEGIAMGGEGEDGDRDGIGGGVTDWKGWLDSRK